MGIFDFFRKQHKKIQPPSETSKKVKLKKTVSEVVEFIEATSNEELIKMACEESQMSNYFEDIFKLVKPKILLLSEKDDKVDTDIGASKIGGNPDVPKNFVWPKKDNLHLSFLLQINCKDLPENSAFELPNYGVISFFYCFDNELENTNPNNGGFGLVFYFEDEELNKTEYPERTDIFNPCKITFANYLSLPYIYDYYSEQLWDFNFLTKEEDLDDGYGEVYWNLEKLTGLDDVNHHQLFGYPKSVQGHNIEVQISKAKLQLKKGLEEFSENELDKVYNQKLILQINEDKDADIRLIDSGKIYYVGEKNDKHLLDNIWTMLDFG